MCILILVIMIVFFFLIKLLVNCDGISSLVFIKVFGNRFFLILILIDFVKIRFRVFCVGEFFDLRF